MGRLRRPHIATETAETLFLKLLSRYKIRNWQRGSVYPALNNSALVNCVSVPSVAAKTCVARSRLIFIQTDPLPINETAYPFVRKPISLQTGKNSCTGLFSGIYLISYYWR
jgi:hypothetical protein